MQKHLHAAGPDPVNSSIYSMCATPRTTTGLGLETEERNTVAPSKEGRWSVWGGGWGMGVRAVHGSCMHRMRLQQQHQHRHHLLRSQEQPDTTTASEGLPFPGPLGCRR